MPIKEEAIEKYAIKIAKADEVLVWIGPCSVKSIATDKIKMDGRRYECGGKVILNNQLELPASFRILTSGPQLLLEDSIYTKIDNVWYSLHENDFYKTTGLSREDIFPIKWLPDTPLDIEDPGPYPMDFSI